MNYQSVIKKHVEDCVQQAFQQSLNYVDHLEAFELWLYKKYIVIGFYATRAIKMQKVMLFI